jgi:hypothetical protein
MALDALPALRSANARDAVELALSVDIGGRETSAAKLCEVLMMDHQALHESVTDVDLKRALAKLLPLATIDNHHVLWFIVAAAPRVPVEVVDLLLSRIGHDRSGMQYQPLPFFSELSELKRIAAVPQYAELLRRVRDTLLVPEAPWTFWTPRLFACLSGSFTNPISLDVLGEWIDAGSPPRLFAVSAILHEAGRHFAFTQPGLVARLLDQAFQAGEDCFNGVRADLFGMTVLGERHGTAGQPFPQDIELRDQAAEMLKKLPPGTRAHQFFADVEKRAKRNISAALTEAEEEEFT